MHPQTQTFTRKGQFLTEETGASSNRKEEHLGLNETVFWIIYSWGFVPLLRRKTGDKRKHHLKGIRCYTTFLKKVHEPLVLLVKVQKPPLDLS